MVAWRNHGNCSYGNNSSSSSSSNQIPCCEMCVTSTAKVAIPGILNFLKMLFDEKMGFAELALR